MILRNLLFSLLVMIALPVHALDTIGTAEPELLPPDKAFAFSAQVVDGTTLQARWLIADGYYMYRDRIRFRTDTPGIVLGEAALPPGKIKDDEFFGKIAVFRNEVVATIPYTRSGSAESVRLTAVSQGCADIGVCYPPHTQHAQLDLSPAPGPGARSPLQSLKKLTSTLGLDSGAVEFLDADDAFQLDVTEIQPGMLLVRWIIAEGYYLYRDKLKVTLVEGENVSLGPVGLPAGEIMHDEFFGETQVFRGEVEARVPVLAEFEGTQEIRLQVAYQGCAEAGICYPPVKKQVSTIVTATDTGAALTGSADVAKALPDTKRRGVSVNTKRQDDVVRVLQDYTLTWAVLFFFAAGVLLAFTACMYPMIPIISSIIVGQGEKITAGKAFLLTFIYVEAVALTYAGIGVVSAEIGAGVQAFFQNPWILGGFALVFVALAISMFGFYSLQLPASWQAKLSTTSNRMKGGTLVGVALMGVLSALIVGPCAGPVLIGALIYTSQSGDHLSGALAMFALGNGLGAPLLVICTSGGKLLPKAGGWMDTIKAVFGVILLGVAILMLERVLPGPVTLALWALWLIIPAIYMGALESLPEGVSGWRRLWKGLGVAMLVYGIVLIIGAATGGRDPFNPLHNLDSPAGVGVEGEHVSRHLQFQRIKSVADQEKAVDESSARNTPVMLDFYADWCTYCVKMEDYTFPDPAVRKALEGVTLLQADVTDNDATDVALLNHFGLFAPPAILFFGTDGEEMREQRLVGYLDAEDFVEHLEVTFGK